MKIVIDEGHNRGQDQGAVSIGNENTMNIDTGEKVITKLQAFGHQILRTLDYVPEGVDVNTSLADRVKAANDWGADLYVSIHANCGGGHGVEVWIGSKSSRDIATRIVNDIAAIGYTNRGIKVQGIDGEHLYVLQNTNMPALLVEQCFVDSASDMAGFNPESMANAIVQGITGQLPQTIDTNSYRIETGTFTDSQAALNYCNYLKTTYNINAYVVPGIIRPGTPTGTYRVITGTFIGSTATDFANKLKAQGTTAYIVDASVLK